MALCKICRERGIRRRARIHLKHYRLPLCEEHFYQWFLRRLNETIRRWNMFKRSVVVAVSGGVDSMVLWHALSQLDYEVHALHIDMGIPNYSERATELVSQFAEAHKLELTIVKLRDEIGADLPEVIKLRKPRPPCATCGTLRRAVLNKVAKKLGAEALATGHHLDDEASALLANIVTWNYEYLIRRAPVLEPKNGFMKKVKPLFRFFKLDILEWAKLNGIKAVEVNCPYGRNASLYSWMKITDIIEQEFPQTKLRFLLAFLEDIQPILRENLKDRILEIEVQKCRVCGEPAFGGELCILCKLRQQIETLQSEQEREPQVTFRKRC